MRNFNNEDDREVWVMQNPNGNSEENGRNGNVRRYDNLEDNSGNNENHENNLNVDNNLIREEVVQNNNENNNNNNNNPNSNNGIKSKEILEISKDFIPAVVVLIGIILMMTNKEKYCNESYPVILQGAYYLQIGFLIKSILQIIFIKCISSLTFLKYSLSAFSYTLIIAYYIFIIYSSNLFKQIPETCSQQHPLQNILVFLIVTLGVFDLFRYAFYLVLIVVGFPCMVYYFFTEPRDFIQRFGIDPDIVDNWPTVKASNEHMIDCVICSEEISEGDTILVLNCHGKHFYHSKCIKEWLKMKINCPICRSTNVF